jgi:hypothetical protein
MEDPIKRGDLVGTIADLGSNTHFHFGVRLAPYTNTANRGALPRAECGGDPAFPEYFADPKTMMGPIVDITANDLDGPVNQSSGESTLIRISVEPISREGTIVEWWVAARTPFAALGGWFSYLYPTGWSQSLKRSALTSQFELIGYPVLNTKLPSGSYTFYFVLDDVLNGKPDLIWLDSVQVNIME